jgi:hypothetical protein
MRVFFLLAASSIVGSIACQFAEEKNSKDESSVSALFHTHYCVVKSMFRPDLGTFSEGADNESRALKLALSACEKLSGEFNSGCVMERCGYGRDSGTSDFSGPSVCQWEDFWTGLGGYTDGPTRKEARINAEQDCKNGTGHTPGIECRILDCVSKSAEEVTHRFN